MGLHRDVRKGLGPMKILFWRVNCKSQRNATWTFWLHRVFRGMYIREFEKHGNESIGHYLATSIAIIVILLRVIWDCYDPKSKTLGPNISYRPNPHRKRGVGLL